MSEKPFVLEEADKDVALIVKTIKNNLEEEIEISEVKETPSYIKVFLNVPAEYKASKLKKSFEKIQSAISYSICKEITPGRGEPSISVARKTDYQPKTPELVGFKPLTVPFGVSDEGKDIIIDIKKAPHILVAGTTGSGKSIFLHSIIKSLTKDFKPEEVKLVLIDPKRVEFTMYKENPHLFRLIAAKEEQIEDAIKSLIEEMDRRFELLMNESVPNIEMYNEKKEEKLPYIVALIDEYADIAEQNKEYEALIVRLAQKSRAAGIHIILATQRPSVRVLTGSLKANFSTLVCLSVVSGVDSMTVLGETGAELLAGRGDMLIYSPELSRTGLIRAQGFYDR